MENLYVIWVDFICNNFFILPTKTNKAVCPYEICLYEQSKILLISLEFSKQNFSL